MENAIDIINLNKVYKNKVRALENINLSVKKGDIFAFLGPNGAGKSTVIGIISSLVTITSGNVSVFGKNIQISLSQDFKSELSITRRSTHRLQKLFGL